MGQNILFIKSELTDRYVGILNLDQFCYIEPFEDTEEHPEGSKSKIYFHGYSHIVDTPYKQLSKLIADLIKANYTTPYQIDEVRAQKRMEQTAEMVKNVLKILHDHHE